MNRLLADNHGEFGPSDQDTTNAPNDGVHRLHPKATHAIVHVPKTFVTRRRSLDSISGPRTIALAGNDASITHLMRRYEEMDMSRTHETVVHSELEAVQQEWQRLRKAYRKSRIQYENAVDPINSYLDVSSADQSIRTLRELYINDRSSMESHAAKTRTIHRKLHLAQTSRTRCELIFMQSAHQWAVDPGHHSRLDLSSPPTSTPTRLPGDSPTRALSSNDIALHVKSYHSKVAEVRSLGERLADQNFEYWNEVARRELRQDHEETLSVTDEQFEEMYSRDREVVSQELAKVIEEAKKIKAENSPAITNANRRELEFPDLESLVLSNANTGPRQGYQESLQAALAKVPPEAFTNAESIRGDSSEHGSADLEPARNSHIVTSWMDDVPLGQSLDNTSDV